jgi:hypothetical protein
MWRRIYLPTRDHRDEGAAIATRVTATEYRPGGELPESN